jgi:hypothetical protein
MEESRFTVEFAEHVSKETRELLASNLKLHGILENYTQSDRIVTVIVHKDKLPRIRKQLSSLERGGYLIWLKEK